MRNWCVRLVCKICMRDLCAGFVGGQKGGEKGLAEDTFGSRLRTQCSKIWLRDVASSAPEASSGITRPKNYGIAWQFPK